MIVPPFDPVTAFLVVAVKYGGPVVLDAFAGVAAQEGWTFAQGSFQRWRDHRRGTGTADGGDAADEFIEVAQRRILEHPTSARALADSVLQPSTSAAAPRATDIGAAMRLFLSGAFAGAGDAGLVALSGAVCGQGALTVLDTRHGSTQVRMPQEMKDESLLFPTNRESLARGIPRMWIARMPNSAEREDALAALRARFERRDPLGREDSPAAIHLNSALIARTCDLASERLVAKVASITTEGIVPGFETPPALSEGSAVDALLEELRATEQLMLQHAEAGVDWKWLRLDPDGISGLGQEVRNRLADQQEAQAAQNEHNRAVVAALRGDTPSG